MPDLAARLTNPASGFAIEHMMMRYNIFMPRLYNFCLSLGFEPGKIMPSRAFCSDENQGYPIIMITKHFGTFPFNHGMVGGIVATDRHGPHAQHGKDLVIIQASHVGYDPLEKKFGIYRRLQTATRDMSPTCGKIDHVLDWYVNEYRFAQDNITLHAEGGRYLVTIDNYLLREDREEGLLLRHDRLIEPDSDGNHMPLRTLSTAKTFLLARRFYEPLAGQLTQDMPTRTIDALLTSELFYFRRNIHEHEEGSDHLERNLIKFMPYIVTSDSPLLTAAQINTQIEFDRTFRTIVKEHRYRDKKILFIAGLNIDISPGDNQLFPLTKFVPWAAFIQDELNLYSTLEQAELVEKLNAQSVDNPHQINLEDAIHSMAEAKEIRIG